MAEATTERRLSISPLVEALRLEPGASVSRALGISGKSLTDFAVLGMDERTAERLAVRAGFVPYLLWPELLDAALAEVEKVCGASDCSERFLPPARGGHKSYCSPTCRRREKMRRYRSREQGARWNRDYARRYRAEVAEIVARREGRAA